MKQLPTRTLRDVIDLLPAGCRLVICTPTATQIQAFVHELAGELRDPRVVCIFSSAAERIAPERPATTVSSIPQRASTTGQAISFVRARLKLQRRTRWVVLDCATAREGWASTHKKRLLFFEAASRLFRKANLRSIWLVSRNTSSEEELIRLKDEGEIFLNLERSGGSYIGQLLTTRRQFALHLFTPFVLRFEHVTADLKKSRSGRSDLRQKTSDQEGAAQPPGGDSRERLFESLTEAVAVFAPDGSRRVFNQKAYVLLGYTPIELEHLSLSDLVPPHGLRNALRHLIVLAQKKRTSGEIELRKRNGKTFTAAINASVLDDGRYTVAFRDISQELRRLRELQQSSDTFRGLAGSSPYPTAVFVHRKLAHSNKAFRDTFPWLDFQNPRAVSLAHLLGRHGTKSLKELATVLDGGHSEHAVTTEVPIGRPDHPERTFELGASSVTYEGKSAAYCTFVDVTERNSLLHGVRESELRFRAMVEEAGEAISIVRDEHIVYANRRLAELLSYGSPAELIGMEVTAVWPDWKERTSPPKKAAKAAALGTEAFELQGRRKDGKAITVEAQAITLPLGGERSLVTYYRDITARKESERALACRQDALELVQEMERSLDGSEELGHLLGSMLQKFLRAAGTETGAVYLVDQTLSALTIAAHHGIPEKMLSAISTQRMDEGITGFVLKTQEPLVVSLSDYPPHLPYKSMFQAEQFKSVIYLPLVQKGKPLAVLMAASKKSGDVPPVVRHAMEVLREHLGMKVGEARAFALIRESEERYRSAVENIADVIYRLAHNGAVQFISPNVERLLGYKSQEFSRNPDLWRMVLHPDDRAQFAQRISNQTLQKDDFHLEYRVLPKGKATYRWVRDSIRYRRGEDGTVVSINGIISDISDRIELEAALIKSEELKSNVLESVQEGVMVLDRELRCIDWNKAMETITGIERAGVIAKSVFEVAPSLIGDEQRPLLDGALAGNATNTDDLPIPGPGSGKDRFVWIQFSPLRDSSNAIRGVVGIATDVSSRKRLEREVRESEETLRNVIDAMGDALMISDLQGRVWDVNREFSRITGYHRGEVLGLSFPYPWVMDEEMARFVTWIAALREKNYLRDFDMTWKRVDGRTVAISLSTTLLRNALGEPVAMLNIARDITDRRRLTVELERKNRQIELLNRVISKANATMAFAEIFETIAREVSTLVTFDHISVGMVTEESRSMTVYASLGSDGTSPSPGSTVDISGTAVRLAIERETPVVVSDAAVEFEGLAVRGGMFEPFDSQISIPFSLKDRVVGTLNVASVRKNAFSGEELAVLQPIAEQIGVMVDRVRLFEKVIEDSKYIHNLVNSIDSVVFTIDRNYRITEANAAWREYADRAGLHHLADEEAIIGMPLEEVFHGIGTWSDSQKTIEQLFDRSLESFSQEVVVRPGGSEVTYSLSITPMIIDERVTGLVFTLTDITGIKKTEEEVRRRNRELMALNAISTSISTSLNLDEVLRVAAEQIREIIRADIVLFYLRDKSGEELHLARSIGLSEAHVGKIRTLPIAGSVTGTVILEQRPLYIRDNLIHEDRVTVRGREVFAALGTNSLGVIPLRSKKQVLGAMDVGFAGAHDFAVQDEQLLLLVGNQLGAAIENAQLYAEVQAQVQRITALYELGRSLTGALDMKTLLESVLAQAGKVLPLDRCIYYAFVEAHHSLAPEFVLEDGKGSYLGEERQKAESLVTEDSVYWDVVTKGASLLENGRQEGADELSYLAVPIKSKDRILGVLAASKKGARVYSDVHLRLLESIGNLTEIAIEKAQLYEDTITKSMQIEERNKELDDFTYVVSHDLKEPLISIEGYSKILLKDYNEKVDEEGKEYLNSVVRSSAGMKNLIDDLLTLSRLGRVSETLQTVTVEHLLQEILHDLRFTMQEKHVVVTVEPGLPEVRYNATQLSMVFRNLIANAIKFNDKPSPRISIGCRRHPDHVEFSVADNGIGIDRQYFDKIFMIFQRLHRSEEYRGTGAGLTIVKKIVEKHRGRVWVESVVGEGTTFYFTVPI